MYERFSFNSDDSYESEELYPDSEGNNGFLDISYHCPPEEEKKQVPKDAILKLKVPGDGNCGFYSLALGLMHLIAQDKLAFSQQIYQQFLNRLRLKENTRTISERARYYKDGYASGKIRVRIQRCRPTMIKMLNALETGRLNTFGQFKSFILSHQGYYEILALAICLAPALRTLSLNLLSQYQNISHIQQVPLIEVYRYDGEEVGFGQLNLLSDFFGIHLNGYNQKHQLMGGSYGEARPEVLSTSGNEAFFSDVTQKPVISIVRSGNPGHWDLLLAQSSYRSPPFYFGFDFSHVEFNEDYPEKREEQPLEIQTGPHKLFLEKERVRKFRNEIIKLKTAVDALYSTHERRIGTRLIGVLESNLTALFISKDAPDSEKRIKQRAFTACSEAVREAQAQFLDRSPTLCNILVNIVLFLASLGVGYLLLAKVHYDRTGRIGFFNKEPRLVRKELQHYSTALTKLYQKEGGESEQENALESLPDPLPPQQEWSKIRI